MLSLALNKDKENLLNLGQLAQNLIFDLQVRDPNNETFEQEGIINGLLTIKDYISESEIELAIEHLLYMVNESDISYPTESCDELNNLVTKYKIANPYQP